MSDLVKDMFKEIFGNGTFDEIAEILKMDPSSELYSAWSAVQSIYNNVMVPIALGLMVIWFLVKFMERATMEQVTLEQTFMLFVKLLAAKFLIDHGLEIFSLMWSLAISLITTVSNVFSGSAGNNYTFIEKVAGQYEFHCSTHDIDFFSSSATPDPSVFGASCPSCFAEQDDHLASLWESFTGEDWDKDLDTWASIGTILKLFLPWIVAKVMVVCASFIAYSRLIEMMLRMCGAPIALSDFMSEGLQGAGWRYLKNFLAICLQGMLIIIITKLYSMLMFDAYNGGDFWKVLTMQFSVSFAAIALMFKSLTLSKELLGTS